ncbi:MAG TPA: adenosylcobinamide amidohydrolase [Polyangia bacterium]|nr:adenosylcobinamide amidohydrolase [Polyangia bacterium]
MTDVQIVEIGDGRALVVPLDGAHEVLSWAIVNGGRRRADCVVWREVRLTELDPDIDARDVMRDSLVHVGRPDAVGLMTARDVRRFEDVTVEIRGVRARCVATVGLGNARAVGDPPDDAHAGTINLLCVVSVPLAEEALVEACALVAEARTAALLASGWPSPVSGRPASGTGTDCIVVAAPAVDAVEAERFAGKHTAVGAAIGAAVYRAVDLGVKRWLEENA